MTIFVEAPARLHMGLLDLRGDLGRKYGGLGAALEAPALLLEAAEAPALDVHGPEAERVGEAAQLFLSHLGIRRGARLRVHRPIPAHAGLGSGTQTALATGRALATLFGLELGVDELARATGRARRSAIGTWAFEQGGFLLEGGRTDTGDTAAPLLLRRAMPAEWRCLLVTPEVPQGLSGSAEDEAFRTLAPPATSVVEKIARQILMVVLPALVEEDLPAFGRGITEVQGLVGEMFASVQGGRFAHPEVAGLVRDLLQQGAAGAGQSSWGPTVFGLFGNEARAEEVRKAMTGRGLATVTAFNNRGARCWRADA